MRSRFTQVSPLHCGNQIHNMSFVLLLSGFSCHTNHISGFQEMAEALFHGCGYVPDLLSLQAWLECAWKGGFDTAGGDMLGNAAQNSDQWIGTTECAALLRFFGLKAQIIDFTGKGL